MTSSRPGPHRHRRSAGGGALVAALLLAGCGAERPSLAEWTPRWGERRDDVATLTSTPVLSEATCSRLHDEGAAARHDLVPAPTADLQRPVTEWIDLVEALGSGCVTLADDGRTVAHDIDDLSGRIDSMVSAETPTR